MLSKFENFSLGMHEVYSSIHKCESKEMAKYGLKGTYVRYLVAMLLCPDGLTISQLCEVCDQDKAAVSRAVSELVGREFIWRDNPRGNHYRARLKLTERGIALAKEVCGSGESVFEEAVEVLNEEQKAEFFNLMDVISKNMHGIIMKKAEKIDK